MADSYFSWNLKHYLWCQSQR